MLKEIEKVIKRIEKNKELKPIKKEKGITLIALIVTIIILIILAGITIATLTGEDGLINNANNAKEETEIANEKEIVDRATINAMGNNKRGNIVREELQDELDRITKVGDTEEEDSGEEFNVVFTQTQRYYTVNYVETYNSGDKEYTEGNELQNWKLDSNTGFPISTNN